MKNPPIIKRRIAPPDGSRIQFYVLLLAGILAGICAHRTHAPPCMKSNAAPSSVSAGFVARLTATRSAIAWGENDLRGAGSSALNGVRLTGRNALYVISKCPFWLGVSLMGGVAHRPACRGFRR